MKNDVSDNARAAAEKISEQRLWGRLMDLAAIGARPDGGVCRHALSREDIEARALMISWAGQAGYEVSVDDAANLWVRRPGLEADADPVIAGSHMDSQPAGGKFDGAYGVLAAFEAMQAMDDAGIKTDRPIDMVAWTNEEGGRFDRGCTGSSVWSGAMPLEDYLDDIGIDGVRLADALQSTLEATPDLPRRPRQFAAHAYIEPHIEQGPVLEAGNIPVAAVTSIQGVRWMNVEISGTAGHAGTTPLKGRRDAFQAAHRAIAALNKLMDDPDDVARFTIGRIIVEPNSPNTIPEKVLFSIDFRHPDKSVLDSKCDQIDALLNEATAPCSFKVTPTTRMDPTVFPDDIVNRIAVSAGALGHECLRLASGAFHDALYAARRCPSAMIFIPCRDGLSHHPDEWAEPAHCAVGASVLAAALVDLSTN
ncbi:MAG: M20 family metallo-hydrolase [Hyphomicrobiales bacterium]|nr:M20 family metallo-hydrolase [Hyphomicrobiales bacterium]